jgi:ribosome-associated protein
MRREIRFRVSRSSGPGGQHAQKTSSRVEALFDVEASQALSPAERARVLERLGATVRAIAQDERSQAANRELATERVVEQVRKAARPRRKRTATVPPPAAKERRLDDKRSRGKTKRLRQPPGEGD